MTWLVTGGAGYIGAHVVRVFRAAGLPTVVLDDLSTGVRERVPDGVPIVVGSVLDYDLVRRTIEQNGVTGVIHLAGRKQVSESHKIPLYYYDENVGGFQTVLRGVLDQGVQRVVLSSSAAVYGYPEKNPISEQAKTNPLSPYGHSKLYCEQILKDVANVAGIDWIALRYFNVAGAAEDALIDSNTSNLIPIVFKALREGRQPEIHGGSHPTPDGSPVRDFIHVSDLAEAHLKAAQHLVGQPCRRIYNVGRGEGVSVRTVIDHMVEVTGIPVSARVVMPRESDASSTVADVRLINQELGWRARFDVREMIASAWGTGSTALQLAAPDRTSLSG